VGILSKLNPFKDSINKSLDILAEKVEDKDLVNELRYKVTEMTNQVYIAALGVSTIPWVDALHKMGRQIISVVIILSIVGLKILDIDLSMEEVLAMGGPGMAYNIAKGQGR